MFIVEKNVPDVYVNESRDFQLLARLYDLVFQASRFSIDSMNYISDTMRCNENLLKLLGTKVGFFSNSTITDDTYRKIVSTFPYIIKYKGSMKAIELIIALFKKITKTDVRIEDSRISSEGILEIQMKDSSIYDNKLFHELIEYVRPVGLLLNYTIVVDDAKGGAEVALRAAAKVINHSPILTNLEDSNDSSIAGIVSTDQSPTAIEGYPTTDVVNNTVGFTYISNEIPGKSQNDTSGTTE